MYSSLTSGVRIKLKTNPFKQYENTPESMRKVVGIPVHGEPGSNGYFKSFIPVADMFQYGYICPSVWDHNILHKVEYTSDPKNFIQIFLYAVKTTTLLIYLYLESTKISTGIFKMNGDIFYFFFR